LKVLILDIGMLSVKLHKRVLPLESEHPENVAVIKAAAKDGIDIACAFPTRPIQRVSINLENTNAGFAYMVKTAIQEEVVTWFLRPAVDANHRDWINSDNSVYDFIIEQQIGLIRVNQTYINKLDPKERAALKFHLNVTNKSNKQMPVMTDMIEEPKVLPHKPKDGWLFSRNTILFTVKPGTVMSIPLILDSNYSYIKGYGGKCSTVNNIKYAPTDRIENLEHMIGDKGAEYPVMKMKPIVRSDAYVQDDHNYFIQYDTYRNYDDAYELLHLAVHELQTFLRAIHADLGKLDLKLSDSATEMRYASIVSGLVSADINGTHIKFSITNAGVPLVNAIRYQIYEAHEKEIKFLAAENRHPSERVAFVNISPVDPALGWMSDAVMGLVKLLDKFH
jgi:hypothetical protein